MSLAPLQFSFLSDLLPERLDERIELLWPQILLGAQADSDSALLLLSIADHEHIGDLLALCVADAGAQRLVRRVAELRPYARLL